MKQFKIIIIAMGITLFLQIFDILLNELLGNNNLNRDYLIIYFLIVILINSMIIKEDIK